jgi:hypothetical protein
MYNKCSIFLYKNKLNNKFESKNYNFILKLNFKIKNFLKKLQLYTSRINFKF